jgi:large subunit ribosomal protein L15
MQIHQLKPIHKWKRKKRVGRGGKKGTYSGKGIKGQKSRTGRKMVPIIRELIKRYPKLRGYKFKSKIKNQKSKIVVLNLEILEKTSNAGDIINPNNLIKKGIIRMIKRKMPQVKILGKGKLSKQLIIQNCKVSKTAKEAIEKAGGIVKLNIKD